MRVKPEKSAKKILVVLMWLFGENTTANRVQFQYTSCTVGRLQSVPTCLYAQMRPMFLLCVLLTSNLQRAVVQTLLLVGGFLFCFEAFFLAEMKV